jgi:GalNAc5-diNAcBac-PP-undecaprenol beta-1,3-glucosyltransferase
MSPAAAVVVPTHDHGPLLELAVRSALRQTIADVEVLIVGDGATDPTRAAAEALLAADERVRFFDNPKGPRHGEIHRREAIAASSAPAILYLCDDDLWLPEHVEHVLALLDGHDVASALSVWIGPGGTVQHTTIDLALPFHREEVREHRETPSLTAMAHTRDWYRGLPHGWRTTPQGISTDSWMWRQLLEDPACRARSGFVPTIVHLPSPQRRDMSPEQRLDELRRYERLIEDPAWRRRFVELTLEGALRECAWFWGSRAELERSWQEQNMQLTEVWEDRARVYRELERLRAQVSGER